ncbi:outer membrane protein assembly factor BamA [soil metagenome]
MKIVNRRIAARGRWIGCLAATVVFALLPHGDSMLHAQDENPLFTEPAAESVPIVQGIEIRYIGQQTIARDRILANMDTRVGDPLSQEKIEGDIKNLYDGGLVDDVRILTEEAAGGVRVIVVVSARAVLGQIVFNGNIGLSDDRLRRAIDLPIGQSFDDADLQVAQAELESLFANKGYANATMSYRTEDAGDGFSRVIFTIDEGQRALLNNISFRGNTVLSDRELRKEIQIKEKSIWRLFIGGGKIDNTVLEADIERVKTAYGDRGYIDADVEVSQQRVDEDKVDLIFEITEGEKYDVASVALNGVNVFTEDELYPSLFTEAGQAYSISNIRDDEKTLRDFYGSKGYADVRIQTLIDRAPGNQLAVTYIVEEGEISYIRKINIEGNDKTKDKVIRREMAVSPGEEYNLVKVDASRQRLQTLQYFSDIDIFPTETGEEGYKDLNVTVAEQSTGSVTVGAGFSSIDNLVGFVELTQTNFDARNWRTFTGAGQRFSAGVKVGTRRRDLSVSLYDPWFNDYKLGVGGELYYRDLLFLSDDYDQTEVGGRLYARKPVGDFSYIQPQYELQQVDIDVDNDASDLLQAEDGTFLDSSLGLEWTYDRRDSNLLTRTGRRVSLGADLSGGFLGGDVETYGFEASASQFFSLPFDGILIFRGEANVVDTYGDGDRVPIFKRTFLGGANNLRGFDFRDVGPKDERGEAIGGRSSAFATIEYTFPIVNRVRGAIFYDVGIVSDESWDLGGDVFSDVGVGIRLFLPIGPIRVDVGFPLQKDEFTDGGAKFNFNIGYQF